MTTHTSAPTPPTAPLAPYLVVDDARGAIEFYKRAFGAVEHARQASPDGKKLIHAALTINGGLLMLCDDFPELNGSANTPRALGGSPVSLHLDVVDADRVFASAVAAGAKVTMPLADQFWGDRYGQVQDPYGHHWSIATRKHTPSQADVTKGAAAHFPEHR